MSKISRIKFQQLVNDIKKKEVTLEVAVSIGFTDSQYRALQMTVSDTNLYILFAVVRPKKGHMILRMCCISWSGLTCIERPIHASSKLPSSILPSEYETVLLPPIRLSNHHNHPYHKACLWPVEAVMNGHMNRPKSDLTPR